MVWSDLNAQVQSGLDDVAPLVDSNYVATLCDSSLTSMRQGFARDQLKYADLALQLADSLQLDDLQARAMILRAYGLHNTFRYEDAIQAYQSHADLQSSRHAEYDTFYLNLNLAKCHAHLGATDVAITYFDNAYLFIDQSNNDNVFEYYFSLAFFFHQQKLYGRALDFRRKLYQFALASEDSMSILKSYNSLGFGFNANGENDSAIFYLKEAVTYAEDLEHQYQDLIVTWPPSRRYWYPRL